MLMRVRKHAPSNVSRDWPSSLHILSDGNCHTAENKGGEESVGLHGVFFRINLEFVGYEIDTYEVDQTVNQNNEV
jgi:hypothetical protein